jgi:uncharacterized protein YjiS (DUF1127 family)
MFVLHFPELAVRRRRAAAVMAALRRFGGWCFACFQRAEQRKRLAELDEHMLKDIGVSPRDAAEESAKPFWRT